MSVLIWIAGAMAATGLAGAVLTWLRGGVGFPVLVSVVALALTCTALVVALDQSARDDLAAEQRILALRADRLAARALAPNSPLACLDAPAGPSVENACADIVFGRPETVASAVGYVASQLALLADSAALAEDKEGPGSKALEELRRRLEADRFGVVAHVLATNSACTAEQCAAFALLSDPSRIKANLKTNAFDRQIASRANGWPAGERGPSLTKAPAEGATKRTGGRPTVSKPLSPGYDFPSASSIPPVSIMSPETAPGRSRPPAAAGRAAPKPSQPPAAAGRAAPTSSRPPAAADSAAPTSSRPPAAAGSAAPTSSRPPAAAGSAAPASSRPPAAAGSTAPTSSRPPAAAGSTAPASSRPPAAAGSAAPTSSRPPAAAGSAAPTSSRPPAAAGSAAPTSSQPPAAAGSAASEVQAGPPPLPRNRPPAGRSTRQEPIAAPLAIAPPSPTTPATSNRPAGPN